MADLLTTSVSGLIAFQQALDVTSNNIANAATPGYSLETANLTPQPGQSTAAGFIGSGVEVSSVTRAYSELLAQQVRSSQASYSSLNTLATQAAQVDNLLSGSSSGLPASLQQFLDALQTLSTSPASSGARQAVLSQAQALAQQLTGADAQISQYGANLEQQISADVAQVSSLASNIASLNGQITKDLAGNGQTPNQLMDQRDQLIDQLSRYVSVNTATEPNGALDVYIGSGQALVTGATAQQLTTLPNTYDASVLQVGLSSAGGTTDVTSEVSGGELGGLLAARSQVLQPAQNALGQLSVGLATLLNQQQAAGIDQSGAAGQPMFAVGPASAAPASTNTGSAALSVTRTALGALTSDDYTLRYLGGAWQLEDATTGAAVSLSGAGTAASPFQAAGVSIVVSGAAANGDSFLIQPTATATAGLSLLLTSPSQIATAGLAQTGVGTANTGTGSISPATVSPASWVPDTYTITFTTPGQYQVTSSSGAVAGSGAYTTGQPISFAGAQVTVSGVPAAGDTFTVRASTAADSGDNSNLDAMIQSLGSAALDNGTTSLAGAANDLITSIGVLTQQAQASAAAQQSVNQDAVSARSNVSGVNLDQEAAHMLEFQRAYQAMAQVIQASQQMFTSLMTAITNG
ncbi:MAG TPA: flagellar hook-associated protein FlgK [Steroidobacteraceae bacterium]|nr:flagellar hook-associated protein FlgK [Steroidobacteraceae bacterium]